MAVATRRAAFRPRDFVRARGPDAETLLQRLLSNDVTEGAVVDALLLTPKARVIAPLRVWRRGHDDFLLLTEPGLGEIVRATLLRARFAAKVELEREEHRSLVVFEDGEGLQTDEYGEPAREVLDDEADATLAAEELERLRIEAGTPAWGKEIDDRVLPAEAGLVERAVSFTKGCYPGQEPIARLHYRGHANRRLCRLRIEGDVPPPYDAELRQGERVVGRVTSAVATEAGVIALGYVRAEVPDDAELHVGAARARLH